MQSSPDPSTAAGGGVLQLGTLLKRCALPCTLIAEMMKLSSGPIRNRLEAATSRLEDIALAQHSQGVATAQLPAGIANGSSSSSSAPVAPNAPSPPKAPAAPTAPAEAQDAPAVQAYRDLIDGPLGKYLTASQDLGDLVAQQVRTIVWMLAWTRLTLS